ncbi:MFS family permease [Crossiella equi]|uniref:MFS family permease n=1 Tax=Crossiella equi TaxID=130796 RepID=A0ABS5ASB2_9PSEU|nr:MFS transporter [Crossiella equi]MBP2479468.1 MFS family permease [Crossiella equi]
MPHATRTTSTPGQAMPFGQVLAVGGRATLGVLLGLQVLDSVDGVLLVVFAPEIRAALGLGTAAVSAVGSLAGVMVALAALPLGILGDRHRRTTIAGVCTLLWAAAAGLLGLVQSLWQVVVIRILAGIGKANEGPIQAALLVETYPPAGRGRVLGLHRAAQPLGIVLGPLLASAVAVLVPAEHEPWRWAFVLLALPALLLGLATLRLREPERGRYEREALGHGVPPPAPAPARAAFARLRRIRTFSSVMVALGAFGLCVVAAPVYLSVLLEERLGQGAAARGVITSLGAVGGLVGAALGAVFSDRLFGRSPAACLRLAAGALALLGIGFAVQAYAPDVLTFTVVSAVTQGLAFAGIIALSLVVAAVTPPAVRATAFALVGVYLAVFGGLGGSLLTSVAEQAWGAQAAIAVVAPTASVLAGLVLAFGARHVRGDQARAAADLLAEDREPLP